MKKAEIRERLLEYIDQVRYIQVRRDKIDDNPLLVYLYLLEKDYC